MTDSQPGSTAGPSFELFYGNDYLIPHREAAWALLEERATTRARYRDEMRRARRGFARVFGEVLNTDERVAWAESLLWHWTQEWTAVAELSASTGTHRRLSPATKRTSSASIRSVASARRPGWPSVWAAVEYAGMRGEASTVRAVVRLIEFETLFAGRDGVLLFRRGRYGRTAWRETETYKFVFVPAGRYAVDIDGLELPLAPGQFVVLNPHAHHRHVGLDGAKLLVEVRSETMNEAATALGRPRPPRFRQLRSSDGLVQAWARAWAADVAAGHELDADEVVAGLALRLLELHERPPHFRAHAAVSRAVQLINERFAERLTIDALAAAVGMERFAFAHAFRRETGIAPHAYIRERRLAFAAVALKDSRPILEVAFDSGFGSLSSFNRAFRKAFGVTPSHYRQLQAQNGVRASARKKRTD